MVTSNTGIKQHQDRNPGLDNMNTPIDLTFWRGFLPDSKERGWTIAAFVVILIGAVLRIVYINQSVGNDEAYTYLAFSSRPVLSILTDYSHPNNHIFHSILAHFSALLFGQVTWAIRLPALLAGILMIPACYVTGRKLYNAPAGLMAASFLAASPTFITYSAQARGYTLLAFFTLVMILLGAELVKQNSRSGWIVFSLCGVLGAFTIPIMVYPLAALYIWLMLEFFTRYGWSQEFRRRIVPVLISAIGVIAGTILVYLPVIMVGTGLKSLIANGEVVSQPWSVFLINLRTRLGRTWIEWNDDLPFFFTFLTVIGFVISFYIHRRLSRTKVHLAIASIIGFAIVLIIHRVAPYTRIWTFVQPWFYIWAGAGLAGLVQFLFGKGNLAYVFFIAALAVYPILSIGVNLQRGGYMEVTQPGVEETVSGELLTQLKDGQLIAAVVPTSTQIKYYFSQKADYKNWFYDTYRQQPFNQLLVVIANNSDQTLQSVLERNKLLDLVDWQNGEIIYSYKQVDVYRVNRLQEVP